MPDDTLQQFKTDIEALQTKYNVKLKAAIDFPTYKILPPEVQLALLIIEKHGGLMSIGYQDIEPKGDTDNGNV